MEYKDAISLLVDEGKRSLEVAHLPLMQARGRILARDIACVRALPPFSNSAMDGYALGENTADDIYSILPSHIHAGESASSVVLKAATAIEIMTGAPLPEGTKSVCPIEKIGFLDEDGSALGLSGSWEGAPLGSKKSASDEKSTPCQATTKKAVKIHAPIKSGANMRLRGEELDLGAPLLQKGKLLNSMDITLLASQGIEEVEVYAPLDISVHATGSELVELGSPIKEYEVYNTNTMMICGALEDMGFAPKSGAVLRDDRASTSAFIEELEGRDGGVIITTGGASKGRADFFALLRSEVNARENCATLFDLVRIKPGKHISVSRINKTLLVNLPGNPSAALLTLLVIIVPMLEALAGIEDARTLVRLALSAPFKTKVPLIALGRVDGGLFIPLGGNSASLTQLAGATALAVIEDGDSSVLASLLPLRFN